MKKIGTLSYFGWWAIIQTSLPLGWCEKFYRSLTFNVPAGKEQFFSECWREGKYVDEQTMKCTNFPNQIHPYDIKNKFARYTLSEIEYICKQMWLAYDNELKMCVDQDLEEMYMSNVGLKFYADLAVLQRVTPGGAPADEIYKYNIIQCLRAGMQYESLTDRCGFIKLNPVEYNRTNALNDLLSRNQLRLSIWDIICANHKMWYGRQLKMCVEDRPTKWRTYRSAPAMTYSGEKSDQFEQHLHCILLGKSYNSSTAECFAYPDKANLSQVYGDYTHLFLHAKSVLCAQLGMAYNRDIDICIQTELTPERRKKRYVDLCDDVHCANRPLTSEHGPNLRLLVSERDRACINRGMAYQKAYDLCEAFEEAKKSKSVYAYQLRYLPHIHNMLRTHCFKHKLGYIRRLRVCASLDGPSQGVNEYKKEKRRLKDSFQYEREQQKICISRGMDYNPVSDECLDYFSSKFSAEDYEFYHKNFVPMQLKMACNSHKGSNRVPKACLNLNKHVNLSSSGLHDLIRSFCAKNQHDYNEKLALCIRRLDSLYPVRKYPYEQVQ